MVDSGAIRSFIPKDLAQLIITSTAPSDLHFVGVTDDVFPTSGMTRLTCHFPDHPNNTHILFT